MGVPVPIYEYQREDGTKFELIQSFDDEPLTRDPETGLAVRRVLHAPALHFKGKGFYNTDYGTRKRQREAAALENGSGPSSGSAAEDGKSADAGKSSPANGAAPAAAENSRTSERSTKSESGSDSSSKRQGVSTK
jgi:predicted nucleic acid-binding Zn ribbon protein